MRMKLAAGCAILAAIVSCQTSPTGRKQLMLVPPEQVNAMGTQAFSDMKKSQPQEADPATNSYVKCVADSVTTAMAEKQPWEVVVFKSDEVNAFALPGAKIGVYTGILKVANTPGQLAAIIGHEVGHVIASHGRERVSTQLTAMGGMFAIDAFLNGTLASQDSGSHSIMLQALGIAAPLAVQGVVLKYSRDQEKEADAIGQTLMARAGFDPRESVDLWRNMAKAGGQKPPEILSTHPSDETRIKGLQAGMDQALKEYQAAKTRPDCKR